VRKGFTLLEILIVVGLLTIMTSISFVAISNFTQKHRSQVQQKTISTDLAYARDLAQIMSVDSNILFYNSDYTIQAAHFSKKIFLQKGYTMATQQLGFTPQGTPKYSRTVLLYYQEKPVSKLTIAVGSGLIRWQNL
jgi:prepilin-type N-terminal cleavage/methylation domain-containing protein